MDHVSANKSLPVTERENISGARVFDGEDQGKKTFHLSISSQINENRIYVFNTHVIFKQVPETDIECNSYNSRIGANNKSEKNNKENNLKRRLMSSLTSRLQNSMTISSTLKASIIDKEQTMKGRPFVSIRFWLNRKRSEILLSTRHGPNQRNMS